MEPPFTDSDRLFGEFRRTGDARALGEVYDRLAPELLGVALHTTRDPAQAEDVLQATFVAAIEQAQRFDPERRVLPWLVGILANEARKARERGTRRPDPERLARSADSSPQE
ncbi:MAG: sigma-70 family RNA polymerase sigma factor, partial [Planctomycetes bacterium]|nr:sigma-70 family RNA polymerase sigma factor [Planctomycetota bacterium]